MKNLAKKSICLMIALLMLLSLEACGSKNSNGSAKSSRKQNTEEPSEAAENEFDYAVNDFLEAQSSLRTYISDAEALLDTVTEQNVDDSAVLGNLREILDNAKDAVETTIPEMGDDADEIQQQAQDIRKQADEMWSLCDDIKNAISQVGESQERYAESNRTEIIMAEAEYGANTFNCTIYGVNPDTGERRTISEFNIPGSVTSNADGSVWNTYKLFILSAGYAKRVPLKRMFSKDYKYIAVTRHSSETNEYRAGCYREGEGLYYTDVTKSIGAVGGDFDEPVKQYAIGFTAEDDFIFEAPDDSNTEYFSVKIADSSAIKESLQPYGNISKFLLYGDDKWELQSYGNISKFLMQGDGWDWMDHNWEVTDWIDETHCLINYPEETASIYHSGRCGVRILDLATHETTPLIPGESRTNWSGVISPDGESVAFLSAPAEGIGDATLYVISVNGGEPKKICEDIPAARNQYNNILTRPTIGFHEKTVSFLLEWRKVK